MERDYLKNELGLTDEQVESVMEAHGKSISGVKQEKSTLEAEVENYKTQITERDNQLEELKNNNKDNGALTEQIDALKTANQAKDAEKAKELADLQKNYEIKLALNNANVRNEIAVGALLNLEEVTLDENNQLTGLNEQLEALKETDGYLFGETSEAQEPPKKDVPNLGGNEKTGNNGKDTPPGEFGQKMLDEIYPQK